MRLPESYPSYVDAGQVIADSLKKVGITCDIEIVDWSTWLSEVYNGREYDLTVVGHTGRVDPIVLLARYGSTSSENYFNYTNDEVDGLIASYRGELDADKRTEYVQQIQRILAVDARVAPVSPGHTHDPRGVLVDEGGVETHGFAERLDLVGGAL